ncbi:MAG: serine/threonine protein kinase, partial [Deltaproteobacteria bacterium]|nr:serine/threonine protein kinase [Deltaproteobacteria bacterium]MBW2531002.1 serine/threonine protein kinase [Deltaproteobacteria bacterium]
MAEIHPGDVIAEKYRLEQAISEGGMGSVWLAQHLQLDAPVAIKFMHGNLLDSPEALARFEREAKSSAQIRSPFVVHVYDHGVDDGSPYIVMEFLEGEDLGARLKRDPPLAPDQLVLICDQVAKGLERAHRLGIVHRDLKPGNVFLSKPDDDMVKLLDFGIAKETGKRRTVQGEVTTQGQVLGSPQYMSPEQARGQDIDGRADLWSLAVILYRALTLQRPFDADDMGDLIVKICTEDVEPPSLHRPDLGPAVDAFFATAFQRNPDDRFQSPAEFAAALRAALGANFNLPTQGVSGTWPALTDSGQYAAFPPGSDPGTPSSSRTPDVVTPSVGTAPSGSLSAVAGPASATPSVGDASMMTVSGTDARRRQNRVLMTIVGALALLVVGAVVGLVFFEPSDGNGVEAPAGAGTVEPTAAPSAAPTA